MRELVITGSSILVPPNPTPLRNLNKFSKPSLLNPSKPSSSPSQPPSPPISGAHSRPLLISTVRWDLTAHRSNHIKQYADLASKLAHEGKFEDVWMIAESMIVSGVDPSQFASSLNVELVWSGIIGLIRKGKVQRVFEIFSRLDNLEVSPLELFDGTSKELLAREFRRLLKCGKLEEVVGLMEFLAGFRFSIKELAEPRDVIKVCIEKSDPTMAIRYACLLPQAHILFCNTIREFGKKRDLVSALTVFEASKGKLNGPNMYLYRATIDVCGCCGNSLKSRIIFEEIINQDVTPNTYVFNSLMNVNAHDLSYTLQVYKHMQNLGVRADLASYNILLKACCLSGRVDLAQDIYKEVQHLESTGTLKLDVFTYSTIIKVFADAKLWQMALKIKEDMISSNVNPNAVTWSSLISACANAGLVEQSFQLFRDMILSDCRPNTQCFNILLHACVEACQYDRAFRLFNSWKESTFHENFREDDGNLVRIVEGVAFAPTTTTYNILMKACGADFYRAKSLMDEMKIHGLRPNHISWSILIDTCGGSGNVEGAMRTLRAMSQAGIKPDVVAYTTAIKVCVESKDLKIAFSLFAEMKRHQIQPNMVTYNTLIRARSRYGSLHEVQQCLGIYQDMRKAGYKANDYYLKELIEEWCEGVIQNNNNHNQRHLSSSRNAELGRPQSLLLEKVAAHLQKSIAETLAIDLQGLTKVEARIVVLAVLRMIKENYNRGNPINDDMLIILGEPSVGISPPESEVKDTITKLLRDEMGLDVLMAGPRVTNDSKTIMENPPDSNSVSEEILGRECLPTQLESSTRRPVMLQRLKVTRKSLRQWLQRRFRAIRR